LVRQIEAAPNIEVRFAVEVVGAEGEGRLQRVRIRSRATGTTETISASELFVMIGARPRADWLPSDLARDAAGFVYTGRDVPPDLEGRDALPLETSLPGVFAVGDIRHESVKRVASAVGEGAVCVPFIHRYLDAHRRT